MDQALAGQNASIPLDFSESGLEDHFQIVNTIAIVIQDTQSTQRLTIQNIDRYD